MAPTPEQVADVRTALDALQTQCKVNSDRALAEAFNLNPKTVSFLSNGRWTRKDRLLIRALLLLRDKNAA